MPSKPTLFLPFNKFKMFNISASVVGDKNMLLFSLSFKYTLYEVSVVAIVDCNFFLTLEKNSQKLLAILSESLTIWSFMISSELMVGAESRMRRLFAPAWALRLHLFGGYGELSLSLRRISSPEDGESTAGLGRIDPILGGRVGRMASWLGFGRRQCLCLSALLTSQPETCLWHIFFRPTLIWTCFW